MPKAWYERAVPRMPATMPNPFEQDYRVRQQLEAAVARLQAPFGGSPAVATPIEDEATALAAAINGPSARTAPPPEVLNYVPAEIPHDVMVAELTRAAQNDAPGMPTTPALQRFASIEGEPTQATDMPGLRAIDPMNQVPIAELQRRVLEAAERERAGRPRPANLPIGAFPGRTGRPDSMEEYDRQPLAVKQATTSWVGGGFTPPIDDATVQALKDVVLKTPQTVNTRDRELRFENMSPADPGHMLTNGQWRPGPAQTPEEALQEQMKNELAAVIPNLEARGYRRVENAPPGTSGIGLTGDSFMAAPPRSPSDMPRRSIHDLRAMDKANQAAREAQPEPGTLEKLRNAIFGTPQANVPNSLSPEEQARVAGFNKAADAQAAQETERRANVTSRAKMKQLGRDIRTEGITPVAFAQLQAAVQRQGGGGPIGPPDPALATWNPRAYAAQLAAFEAVQNQQRLTNQDKQQTLRDKSLDLRHSEQMEFAKLQESNAQRRHEAELKIKDPSSIFAAALTNPAAANAAGLTEDQQIAIAVESVTDPTSRVPALLDRKLSLLYPESARDWWGGEKEFLEAAAKVGIPDRIAKPYWDRRRKAELAGSPIPEAGGVKPAPELQRAVGPKGPLPSRAQFGAYSAL